MATITLGGNKIQTVGELPSVGERVTGLKLTSTDLEEVTLDHFNEDFIILNIFPSVDTGVCATSVRNFNERAEGLGKVKVLCVSADLPFAHKRFCENEGLKNVVGLSSFRNDFGKTFGVEILDGAMQGLCSRAVLVLDKDRKVIHAQQVPEIADEPDYDSVLAAIEQ